jgi:exosortase
MNCFVRDQQHMAPVTDRSYTGRRRLLLGVLVVSGVAVLYRDVLADLVRVWSTDDNYSHGFLIPPIAAFLAWERRGRFRAAPAQPSLAGLVMVAGSILLLVFGAPGAGVFLARMSIVSAIAGVVLLLFGWSRLRTVVFPLAILLLMIPLPAAIFERIEFPLQIATSALSEALLRLTDIPVVRDGNLLALGNVTLEVARECSGVRTAISLATLGLVFGYVPDSRPWLKVLVAVLTLPVVVVTNGGRVATTAIAAHYYGPGAATGFFHDLCGWLAFAAAFAIMLLLNRFLIWAAPTRNLTPPTSANAYIPS